MFSSEAVFLWNRQNKTLLFSSTTNFFVKGLGLKVRSQCEKLCLSIQSLLHRFPLSASLCIAERKKENCTQTSKSLVLKYYILVKQTKTKRILMMELMELKIYYEEWDRKD